ncbi:MULTISPECIES: hypothetical protein [unclassified Pandoraea]|nr:MULTISPECIES: hypothetical protein [unclassified Pandoraea]
MWSMSARCTIIRGLLRTVAANWACTLACGRLSASTGIDTPSRCT